MIKLLYREQPKVKERIKEYNRIYGQSINGSKHYFQKNHKRRTCKMNIIENFTFEDWLKKVQEANGICPVCKCEGRVLTCDHIYPISVANKDYLSTGIKRIYEIEDVQPLCKSCNSSKRDKI